jgi:VIT1/CCC1 family predicted Fe2+/Mn2+ transporter
MRLEHSHSPQAIADRLSAGPNVSYLRDWIYGGIDGLVTTFAIVAGAVGADMPARVVLILGVAKLIADALSMAAANYSGTKAEHEEYDKIREMEERHVALHPEGEREEVRQIFRAKGFDGEDLDRVVNVITEEQHRWIDTMMAEEHGMPLVNRLPSKAALAVFAAFVLCGSVPLLPYLFGLENAAVYALVMTGATFFAIGSIRSYWSPRPWWMAGLETFCIGMLAAGAAYLIGDLLSTIV